MKIPKFENETDEANWLYEHREELAEAFMNQHRQHQKERSSRLEAVLDEALQTKGLEIAPEELDGSGLVVTLRTRLKAN